MSGIPSISPAWRDRLAVLGGVAACVVAAKTARLLWLRAQLRFGPVLVSKFKGQWALVTGGSEGLGKAIALALAKQGLHLVLVSRSQQKLNSAAAEIKAKYPDVQVRTIPLDLCKADNCSKLLQQLKDTPIRVLIANAGGGPKTRALAPYWEYTSSDEAFVVSLNGVCCYTLVKGLLPSMLEAGQGAIVGISSLMSRCGTMAAAYGAEKAKMNALMEALDGELHITGHTGVTAQAMVIGATATPAIAKLLQPALENASPSEISAALASHSSKLPGCAAADDVAEDIVRSIGRVGPVVTPHWRHALTEALLSYSLWPPSLQRCFQRHATRQMLAGLQEARAKGPAAQSS